MRARIDGFLLKLTGGRRRRALVAVACLYLRFCGVQDWTQVEPSLQNDSFDLDSLEPAKSRGHMVFTKARYILTETRM